MSATPDLQFAFDVGHSSIGWAVLQNRIDKAPELLGCGAVIFPADDCLASKRRRYRQMRRHIRATRQRIERMGRALLALDVGIPPDHIKQKPAKGESRPAPWLLAARVLAARTESERVTARLSWSQLWDVLRWYAHNRGYDAHLRFTPDGKALAFADEPAIKPADFAAAEQVEAEEDADEGDAEHDSEKLRAGEQLCEDYGTTTFAETMTRFLLGPPRAVKPGQPGKPGKPEPLERVQSEEEFRKLLFETPAPFNTHPVHPVNYFKGVRAAFPRRVLRDDGVLVGGTEWEVRRILRLHFGVIEKCDAALETAFCGAMPETHEDWRALGEAVPDLYVSTPDRAQLRAWREQTLSSESQRAAMREQRRSFLAAKLALPKRFEGGLLFGQLGMRYHNRIIATCRFSYARILRAFRDGDDAALKPYNLTCKRIKTSRRTVDGRVETDSELSHRWAQKIAKVPASKSSDFLLYRWSMRLADLTVSDGDRRNLDASERQKIDAAMHVRGWLTKDELAKAIKDATGCKPANLQQTFDATPEAVESLCIDPLGKYLATNGLVKRVARHLDPTQRKKLSRMLESGRPAPLRAVEKWLDAAGRAALAQEIEDHIGEENAKDAEKAKKKTKKDEGEAPQKRHKKKKLTVESVRRSSLRAPIPSGRATYHRVILRQARAEILRGEDPRKAMRDDQNPKGEVKAAHGCLFQTPEINRHLIAGAKSEAERADDFTRWRERWLGHARNRKRHARLESEKPGAGEACVRGEWQSAQTQGWLARQTNNHLVRHRLLFLDRLTRDIIDDPLYGGGQSGRVGSIAIEVARDLLTFSGKERKGKTGVIATLDSMKRHHAHVGAFLAERLAGTQWEHKINGELIWKAKVADDLGWCCPFTGQPFCPCDLASGTMDIEHIIPKSRRLTDAMEAVVITYKTINAIKGDRTAWQFVKEFEGQKLAGIPFLIRPLKQYEAWVENKANASNALLLYGDSGKQRWPHYLPGGSGGKRKLHPDFKRRRARRHYLLIEEYDQDKAKFTPRDLTITSHLCRLAQQVLLRALPIPDHAVTALPGGVTGALRDARGWRLLKCLDGAATNLVMRAVPELDRATGLPKVEKDQCFLRWIPKPKGDIRKLTHLHHALDAGVIGLLAWLLPKDGKSWELIAKGELNSADVWAWDHATWRDLIGGELPDGAKAGDDDRVKLFPQLKPLFSIVANHDGKGNPPKHDHQWRIEPSRLEAVAPGWGKSLHERLKEQRVVEQMPADYGLLDTDETVYRVFDPSDPHPSAQRLKRWFERLLAERKIKCLWEPENPEHKKVFLVTRKRRADDGKDKGETLHDVGPTWRWIYVELAKDSVLGLPPHHSPKLAALKAGKKFGNNYALAYINGGSQSESRMVVIRPHAVWTELRKLAEENGSTLPLLLRKGQFLELPEGDLRFRYRVAGFGLRERGFFFYVLRPDELEEARREKSPLQLGAGGEVLKINLCASVIARTPIPMPADKPRKKATRHASK